MRRLLSDSWICFCISLSPALTTAAGIPHAAKWRVALVKPGQSWRRSSRGDSRDSRTQTMITEGSGGSSDQEIDFENAAIGGLPAERLEGCGIGALAAVRCHWIEGWKGHSLRS